MTEKPQIRYTPYNSLRSITVCCQDFAHAFERSTDSEYYESLFNIDDNQIWAGCHGIPLNFCPWCGASLEFDWLTESKGTK